MKLSDTVRSLLASSLGLPGMQDLLAQEAPEEGLSYRFTHYDEEPVPQDRLALGDPRRYRIDSHQLRWVRNEDEGYTLTVGYLHEAMSGSSPWYVIPGEDGTPLQVMSGATIRENRDQLDLALARRAGGYTHTAALGVSTEDDYQAVYGSYAGEKESGDGLRTLSWGLSYSDDEVEPSDALLFGRVESAGRDSLSVSAGLTQVINRNAVLQTGLSLTRQSGYLSDPYKLVWIARQVVSDSRPDERDMLAWTTRFRQYFQRSRGALHLDYRYYRDDWSVRSHTLEAAWHQPLGEAWELAPSLRYYTQTDADFYQPYFSAFAADGFWSSDFRLSTYGALSYRLQATLRLDRTTLGLGAEYYDSDGSLALSGSSQQAPALVDFWRLSASFTVRL